jgi:hypothetical protein
MLARFLATVAESNFRADDPRSLRERFYRQHLTRSAGFASS